MSTLDTAALWSATTLAFDEKKLGAAGLSVRQRKLLALLNQPASVSQLAQSIALPDDEVQTALERFAKLGLAQSDAPKPFNPMQVRATPAAAVVEKPSRMPLMIGVAVAALALVAASAWLLRGGSGKTSIEPAVAKTAPASPSTPTGPTDSADSKLPRSAAAPAAITPSVSPTAASPTPAAPPATAATKAAPTPTPAAAASATRGKNAVTPITAAPAAAPAVATVAPTPATTTATAPVVVAAPTVAATAPPSVQPAAAAVAPPAATPSTTVAAAPAAAARPAPAAAREIKLINRVEPGFPRGVDAERGTVRARLQVDARGTVTSVDIVESNPPRVFDRTVRSALQQWRYEPTGEAFTTAAEISFSR